ncbi:MAG: succinylglutamate desuccinylase/aspartoacylase family protein, partial [Rhodospirillaceae bacterium]|nr:succinylglutamate desuccinylase/aspartoacylase family protein [Rhodospirillaceae bacterium]
IGGRLINSAKRPPVFVQGSRWVRSPMGGVFRALKTIGDQVNEGSVIGYVSDPFGDEDAPVEAIDDGIIIGRTNLPFVNPGDALFHIGHVRELKTAERNMEAIGKDIEFDPLFDEDEIL